MLLHVSHSVCTQYIIGMDPKNSRDILKASNYWAERDNSLPQLEQVRLLSWWWWWLCVWECVCSVSDVLCVSRYGYYGYQLFCILCECFNCQPCLCAVSSSVFYAPALPASSYPISTHPQSNPTHLPLQVRAKTSLMTRYCTRHKAADEVPDPYYGGPAGFERVLDLLEDASEGLLAHIQEQEQQGVAAQQ